MKLPYVVTQEEALFCVVYRFKGLIARPYESVKRAMPGSYYSDVERTVYLTWYILMEDIAKYNELFQQERKFINFEYFNNNLAPAVTAAAAAAASSSAAGNHIDYDDLVYGNISLSDLVTRYILVLQKPLLKKIVPCSWSHFV